MFRNDKSIDNYFYNNKKETSHHFGSAEKIFSSCNNLSSIKMFSIGISEWENKKIRLSKKENSVLKFTSLHIQTRDYVLPSCWKNTLTSIETCFKE